MKRCHFYFIGILPLLSFILLLLQLNSNRPRMGVRLSVGVVIGLGMGSLKTIRIGPELETVFMHLRLPRTTSRVLGLTQVEGSSEFGRLSLSQERRSWTSAFVYAAMSCRGFEVIHVLTVVHESGVENTALTRVVMAADEAFLVWSEAVLIRTFKDRLIEGSLGEDEFVPFDNKVGWRLLFGVFIFEQSLKLVQYFLFAVVVVGEQTDFCFGAHFAFGVHKYFKFSVVGEAEVVRGQFYFYFGVDQEGDEHHEFVADAFEDEFGIGGAGSAFFDIGSEGVGHMFIDVVKIEFFLVDLYHLHQVGVVEQLVFLYDFVFLLGEVLGGSKCLNVMNFDQMASRSVFLEGIHLIFYLDNCLYHCDLLLILLQTPLSLILIEPIKSNQCLSLAIPINGEWKAIIFALDGNNSKIKRSDREASRNVILVNSQNNILMLKQMIYFLDCLGIYPGINTCVSSYLPYFPPKHPSLGTIIIGSHPSNGTFNSKLKYFYHSYIEYFFTSINQIFVYLVSHIFFTFPFLSFDEIIHNLKCLIVQFSPGARHFDHIHASNEGNQASLMSIKLGIADMQPSQLCSQLCSFSERYKRERIRLSIIVTSDLRIEEQQIRFGQSYRGRLSQPSQTVISVPLP